MGCAGPALLLALLIAAPLLRVSQRRAGPLAGAVLLVGLFVLAQLVALPWADPDERGTAR